MLDRAQTVGNADPGHAQLLDRLCDPLLGAIV